MEAEYHYYDNDLLEHVEYGNFTSTWYDYDAARRLTSIEHRRVLDTILRLEYTYTDNDLVATITEYDNAGWVATVTFDYDNRGRLISEARTGENPYDLAYEYDQGGNRVRKLDGLNDVEVVYHYDIEDPATYGSANNRLMYYETFDIAGVWHAQAEGAGMLDAVRDRTEPRASARADKPNPKQNRDRKGADRVARTGAMAKRSAAMRDARATSTQTLLSTTWYYYNSDGNVTEVFTVKENPEPGEPQSSLTRLEYAINGQTVTYVLGETWGNGQDYNTSYARGFRYDGARQRYLNRELDPETLEPVPGGDTWSDYDGDEIYGDYMIDGKIVTNLRSFEPGIGKVAWNGGQPDPTTVEYYHTNQIGTTRLMTDSSGAGILPATYTAFGERLDGTMSGPGDRYGYAGAWGYQSHDELPYLHVGARYYDPGTGRFLQRDPIGIFGGLNVYLYAAAIPTIAVDPDGEFFGIIIGGIIGGVVGVIVGGITGGVPGAIAGGIGGAIAGGLAGAGVPAPAAGAIGGAVSGAINGFAGGKSPGGIAGSAGVGAAFGAASGAMGGAVSGGYGTQYGAGIGSGLAAGGVNTYFMELPAAMCGAIKRLPRRSSPGG